MDTPMKMDKQQLTIYRSWKNVKKKQQLSRFSQLYLQLYCIYSYVQKYNHIKSILLLSQSLKVRRWDASTSSAQYKAHLAATCRWLPARIAWQLSWRKAAGHLVASLNPIRINMLHDYEVWIKLFGAIQQIPWVTVIRWQLTIETYWNIISHLVEYDSSIFMSRLHIWHPLWDVNTINSKETTTRHLASNLPWTSFALKPDLAATPLTRNISGDYIVLIRLIYTYTIVYNYYRILQMWHSIWQSIYNLTNIYTYIYYINIDIPWFIWSCEAKNLPYFFLFLSFLGTLHAHSPQAQTDCGSLQSPVCSQIWRLPGATCCWMCLSCCQTSKDQTIPPSKKKYGSKHLLRSGDLSNGIWHPSHQNHVNRAFNSNWIWKMT